ncbi:MAG: choice-of-anchor I family protein, partial [Betaproteobacteria bacterium]|nr:choice-of-anchor I family protein [Betaproteobacteria bacterium]
MNNKPPQPPAAPAHPITTLAALAAALGMSAALAQAPTASGRLQLELIGQYQTNLFDESAAEINAYDPQTRQLFVINSQSRMIDVLDISDPTNPQLVRSLDVSGSIAGGGDLNSLAVQNGIVALAVANDNETDTGWAVFLAADNLDLPLATARVGALPDMITFTPDGRHALVANEGEPNDSYAVDPQGSIAVIDLGSGSIADVGKVGDDAVRIAGFEAFSADQLREKGVRIFGANNPSAAQDLEPEYIAVSADSSTAYVALQENNALAIVDIAAAAVTDVVALGFKDHSQPGNELDASNKDGQINIRNWPVLGMYQPDALATYAVAGKTYMVTANEGDARDYDGFSEETRIKDLNLDAQSFPTAGQLQKDANLGRLKTTTTLGDSDGDGDFDQIYSYGARS